MIEAVTHECDDGGVVRIEPAMHIEKAPAGELEAEQVAQIFNASGWDAMMPTALPDAILVRLVCQFRIFFEARDKRDWGRLHAPNPLVKVVNSLILQHPKAPKRDDFVRMVSSSGLEQIRRIYSAQLEEELLGRITGIYRTHDPAKMAWLIWDAISAHRC